ncbi:MAG: pyruvate formate lyase family protein, partial [Anaerolinea sp.]|nr:pyruvate formate lyase family protein [Anaerolinea sp.]
MQPADLVTQTTHPFAAELAFTETYRRHLDNHPALREAHCLDAQFPTVFLPLRPGDRFAGRMAYNAVGFSPQHHSGQVGYYCDSAAIRADTALLDLSPADRRAVEAMLAFWQTENTTAKVRAAFPAELARILPSDRWTEDTGVVFPLYRMAGAALDYDRLLGRGIPGLRADVIARRETSTDADALPFFDALLMILETLVKSALYLAAQAESAADSTQFKRIAASLRAITMRAPVTLHEAIQLVYLYTFHATLQCNFGRMDVYLGDFLAADLAAGRTTREEALDDLVSFWRMMPAHDDNLERVKFDLRVIVGGRGRRNPENADQFALLALDASDRVRAIVPQLSLRCHTGMSSAVYTRALDLLGQGATFPILYNDDVNIPAVMHAFNVDEATAAQYVPFGCGEMIIEHRSFGTPNAIINLPKALEVTLHNGVDPITGQQMG